jgi:hypothetical protein
MSLGLVRSPKRLALLRLIALAAFVAGVAVSAQVQLPSAPMKQFGASISPAFDGWFDYPSGSQGFLASYYNRNTEQEVDVPIGPNNHFEPGDPDRGQPTHFLPRRRFGMFAIDVPKTFSKTDKVWWVVTVNGVTNKVPLYMNKDYYVSPFTSTEESPNGGHNAPPQIRFEEGGPSFQGPAITIGKAISRTATAGMPMALNLWIDDDALYSNGGSGPMTADRAPVTLTISKYRGTGAITIADARPKLTTTKGGKAMEPYSGKASTTVTFSQPGEYVLHVTANDYSGNGGGGSVCCWTNALLKITVSAAGSR